MYNSLEPTHTVKQRASHAPLGANPGISTSQHDTLPAPPRSTHSSHTPFFMPTASTCMCWCCWCVRVVEEQRMLTGKKGLRCIQQPNVLGHM